MLTTRQCIPDSVFDHVAIASHSISDMLPLYAGVLGGKVVYEGGNAEYGYRVVQLKFKDGSKIELLEPTEGSKFLDSFLRHRPLGGLHHVTFRVPDIDRAMNYCVEHGFDVFGFRRTEAWSEFFMKPTSTWGSLVQLAEF